MLKNRPLPDALRQRLRDIPQNEVLCRDVDRLYRAARSVSGSDPRKSIPRDADRSRDRAAERHLEECPRCHELYTTIADGLNVRQLPLPQRLARNLGSIARRPERLLPIWIADTRYAAAACYLLAALTLSMAGEASALWRETSTTVSSRAQVWIDRGATQSLAVRRAWDATLVRIEDSFEDSLEHPLEESLEEGWRRVVRFRTDTEAFFTENLTKMTAAARELIPGQDRPTEGENHGGSGNDA